MRAAYRSAWAVLIGLVLAAPAPSAALQVEDLLMFPLATGSETLDLSDAALFAPLSQGIDYTYDVSRIGVHDPSGNAPTANDPNTWTILTYQGTVQVLAGFDEVQGLPGQDLILVFTSLRKGSYTPGSLDLPPFLDGGYVTATLEDDGLFQVFDPQLSLHGSAGVVIDDEGSYFPALRFEPLIGVDQSFTFEVALRETLAADETLYHFSRGFVAIPEPGVALLAAAGLFGIAFLRFGRRR